MKAFNTIIFFAILTSSVFSQGISLAPADKAVVYFARPSALGFAINFSYFDSAKLIGRFNGSKYIRYECEPGKHLFWARSENRSFVKAELEAGKIYFLKADPRMGALKAGVNLIPVNPDNPSEMKNIIKIIEKKPAESFTEQQLADDVRDLKDAIDRGLAKYQEDKAKGKTYDILEKSKYYKGAN